MQSNAGLWVLSTVLLLPVCAFADSTGGTDWSLLPSGGSYSWNGQASSGLVGSNIGVGSLDGVGTTENDGDTLGISFGDLNFTSGAYDGNGSNWSWGAGGTLNITGCIAGVTSTTCTGSNNVVLLGDDFESVSIVPVLQLGKYEFDVSFGALQGTLNSAVAAFFGLSDSFTATSLNLVFTAGTPGSAFNGTNIGGQINATSSVAVSEDWGLGSMMAFFAFAAAIFGLAWRLGLVKPVVF
jgi:hypothetical protein